jgi:hypothetical protein
MTGAASPGMEITKSENPYSRPCRFSIDFQIHTLGYGFLCGNLRDLAKVLKLLVRGFFS